MIDVIIYVLVAVVSGVITLSLGIGIGKRRTIRKGLCGDLYLGEEGLNIAFDSEKAMKETCTHNEYIILRNCTSREFFGYSGKDVEHAKKSNPNIEAN